MKELYYYIYINEIIIRKYNYNKYKDNKLIIERIYKNYKFNNQIITLKTNNKNFKLKDYIKIVNNFLSGLKFNNFNSCYYVTFLYLKDQINYLNNNYKLSNKEVNKIVNNINYTILESF